jgi:hypothetical protein
MKKLRVASSALVVATFTALAVTGAAQEQKPPASGIFVEPAGGGTGGKLAPARFEEVKETGVGKSMLTMGLSKPQAHGSISGPRADTRVPADVAFRIQFDPRAGTSTPQQNMSMADMMSSMNGGDGGMPLTAKTPQDIALMKLTSAGERRDANFGTPGSGHPKDAVDFSVEDLGGHAYRVRPRHPLPPGEYAFFVRMGNMPMGQAWDFGVDAK